MSYRTLTDKERAELANLFEGGFECDTAVQMVGITDIEGARRLWNAWDEPEADDAMLFEGACWASADEMVGA